MVFVYIEWELDIDEHDPECASVSVKNKESSFFNSVDLQIHILEKIELMVELNLLILVLTLASLKLLKKMNKLLNILISVCTSIQVLNAMILWGELMVEFEETAEVHALLDAENLA